MADTKISALTSASTPLAGTEVLPIVQSSTTVKVATNDLTVRNVRANTTTGILQITGPTAATTRVATVPDANFTVARTDATQTFTGTQRFTGAIMGGSSNVNYEILGTSAYSAVLVGAGIARASKISPTDDSGYVGWLFSSQTDTYSTSTQLPSDGATFANRFKVDGLNGDATVYIGNLVVNTAGKGVKLPGGITWTSGSGSPEGVVTAPVGSLYSRSDGGLLTSLYVKESGAGNTGWVGK